MGARKTLLSAVKKRDPEAIYWTLIESLAASFDKTNCTRDKAQLANRIMDGLDKALSLTPQADLPEEKRKEVSRFEAIASRRYERREAAEG